jgi:hypothetical protein
MYYFQQVRKDFSLTLYYTSLSLNNMTYCKQTQKSASTFVFVITPLAEENHRNE